MLGHCPPWAQGSYAFLSAHKMARKAGKKGTEVERVRKQDARSQALGVSEGSLCWGNIAAAKWKSQNRHRTPAEISRAWAFSAVYVCRGWGGAWFCLRPALSLGTRRSLLPLPGEISPSQQGHLTRGGWNVVTWPADPGLIRAEQGHGKRASRYRQTEEQTDTNTHAPRTPGPPCPARSSGLLSSQLGRCPASLQPAPQRTPPSHHSPTRWGEVQAWELFHSTVPSSDNSSPKSHESGPGSKALLWAALCNFHFFHTKPWECEPEGPLM